MNMKPKVALPIFLHCLLALPFLGCSSKSDDEITRLKERIEQLESEKASTHPESSATDDPRSNAETTTGDGREQPTPNAFDPLTQIKWDTSAFSRQFEILDTKYDPDYNAVVWRVRMKGSYYNYSFYDFRLLDEDGIEIDKVSSFLGVSFQPVTPPDEGEPARLTLSLPDKRILKRTKMIVCDRTDP